MDDEIEIDLRKIILKIISGWKWIFGSAFIIGLVSFAFALQLPTQYEAQALLAITKPHYIANFDPRYQTVDQSLLANKSFLDIANSDEIIQAVVNKWNELQKDSLKLDEFRGLAKSSYGSDANSIKITVISKDPRKSAILANLWANLFLERVNILYSGNDPAQLDFFQNQLAEASKRYKVAQENLVEFQKRNEVVPLTNVQDSLLATQTETLQKQRKIRSTQEDARALIKQLANQPVESRVSSADELNWTILRANYYSAHTAQSKSTTSVDASSIQLQLQIPTTNTDDAFMVPEQIKNIQTWIDSLDQQFQSSLVSLQGVNDQITASQSRIQALENEQKSLIQERDLASETFVTLSRKKAEVQISTQQQSGDIRFAANAEVPTNSLPNPLFKVIAIGFVAGAIIGCFIFLIIGWWKKTS